MKKLLFILSLFFIITSCDKTPIITLSVDKSEISADGKDIATFKVISTDKHNNEEDVTNNSQIFFADSKLEVGSTTFSTTEPNSYSFYATYEDAVSNKVTVTAIEVEEEPETPEDPQDPQDPQDPEEPTESPIILSASKTSIANDGKDNIIFTVMQDSLEITSQTKIYVGDTKLKLNIFTSTTAGTYTAYAMKGELKSNEITITVEDENENPSEPENPEIPEEPEQPEPEKPITLTASTTNITANGTDAVTFTVMQENNDVTSQSNIFINGGKLNGNKFTTYTAGTYTAYAQKNDAKSNEITIYVEAVADMGKTIVFADGVSISSGWYDVNKLTKGGADVNMCWAAASANIIQWWQDRYVELGHTLPSTAITGAGTKTYDGTKYNLAIMEAYRDLWDNSRGGSVSHGVTWYFEGRNIMKEASAGTHAQPLNANTGGYYSNDWNSILPNIYHGYDYVIVPGILEYKDLISGEFNNYSIWGNGSGLSGNASLKKFSDLVVEFIDRGVTSLTVALAANLGSIHHATTLWGYEIDNATGIITKVWLTDSDDIHQNGESGNPTQQMLREYAVSYTEGTGTIKFAGAPYGACYAVSLYPVSKYGSR
ncbi:MAG: IdeS/Mac family cysteine endopeptidase [Bacteroidales bacterium]|nr:IdeS/Mac family cysteine endopeptidase [Bacteroidales bacterium]